MTAKGAGCARETTGFEATSTGSIMIRQIQVTKVKNLERAKERVVAQRKMILKQANTQSRTRKAVDVKTRGLKTPNGLMLIVELLVDVKDSMGANIVDSMCEAVAPLIQKLTGGEVNLKMVSNLATKRLVHVKAVVSKNVLGGEEVVDRIIDVCVFAENDPYRAATHNKGIMNAVSAVLMATNNDTRAVEAGAHTYAAMSGKYLPLSTWHKNKKRNLEGNLTMLMAVRTIGGAISTHPTANIALKILRVETETELGEIAASAGLAYNLAALQTLVTTGIRVNQ